MAYYIMGALGGVYGVEPDEPLRAGEKPVVVIDRTKWERLTEIIEAKVPWEQPEIDAIIDEVKGMNQ